MTTVTAVLLGLLAFINPTSPLDCPAHFADGKAPAILAEKLAEKTIALCMEGYAAMHSGVSRTPLWSAEHLSAARLGQARMVVRRNAYHEEERLPFWHRAELADYARSGLDRGHLSPSADMATDNAQYESFSLANIIPQHPKNNQVLWEGIEYSTRELVFQRGELYVISGPIFEGKSLKRLHGRVLVPSHIFKALYDPVKGEAGAYVAANGEAWDYQTVSIAELEQRLGIDLFPGLPAAIKAAGMALPRPQPYQYRRRR